MPIRIHLDTDIGGDTDDLCALSLLLASPEVELVGITTSADAEGRRRGFAEHALQLAGRSGIPAATGARGFLGGVEHFPRAQDARYWPNLEELEPTPPGRALDLLEANARSQATVVAIGPFTNLATLETLCPGVFAHTNVVVMGGYLGMPPASFPQWPASYDYNVQADRVAAHIVFEKLNPLVASLNVTQKTSLRARDLPRLQGGGPLARLMALQAEVHAADHDMATRATESPAIPADILNYQYDSLACAAAIGLDMLTVAEDSRAPRFEGENLVLSPDPNGPVHRFVTGVDSEAFATAWLDRVATL
jgi:purine nucleosidase